MPADPPVHPDPADLPPPSAPPTQPLNDDPIRQRSHLLNVIRIVFLVLLGTVTLLAILDVEPGDARGTITIGDYALNLGWEIIVGCAASLLAIVTLIDLLTKRRKISTLVVVFFGLLTAMLATAAIGVVVDVLTELYDITAAELIATIKVLVGIALAYLAISTVLQTQDDFRLVIPYVEFAKQHRGVRPILLDTSALIDARVADIADTGLLQSPLIVPRFVVDELHALADSADRLKRARGRRGLDVVARLQRNPRLDVSIDEAPRAGVSVDRALIALAAASNAWILTTDLGLKRVATIEGVPVLNLNDLANALKPAVLPGEHLSLRLIRPGEQPAQGVGYLDDGTMVVVEDGAPRIGQDVSAVVTSMLQTSAGRLIFARLAPDLAPDSRQPPLDAPPAPSAPASQPGSAPPGTTVAAPQPAAPGPFPPAPHPPSRFSRARNPRR